MIVIVTRVGNGVGSAGRRGNVKEDAWPAGGDERGDENVGRASGKEKGKKMKYMIRGIGGVPPGRAGFVSGVARFRIGDVRHKAEGGESRLGCAWERCLGLRRNVHLAFEGRPSGRLFCRPDRTRLFQGGAPGAPLV